MHARISGCTLCGVRVFSAPLLPMAEEQTVVHTPADDQSMGIETVGLNTATNGSKRGREENATTENGNEAKKPKFDEEDNNSVEEQRLQKEVTKTGPVSVGYKEFNESVEMFDYFFKLLHYWPPNLNVNKYEHTMLLDLLKRGHLEAEKKMGTGIKSFQVRYHPQWKSRCFFLVRVDGSADDFSFRKCVDHILPLPEDMVARSDVNKALGGGHAGGSRGGGHAGGGRGGGHAGGGRGGGRGNWRGRGRGGKPRN